MKSTLSIFINYRREDSSFQSDTIYRYLVKEFGQESVFKDDDTIPAGVDFRQHIDQAVGKCQVLLAVIGKNWLDIEDENGKRRLENPTDFVRLEIEAALREEIPVIPILVDDVRMPSESILPREIKDLAFRNARMVRPGPDFDSDMKRLVKGIESYPSMTFGRPVSAISKTITRKHTHKLVVSSTDRNKIQEYSLISDYYILGRSYKSCNIVLRSPVISQLHLSLTRDRSRLGSPFVIKDMGSTNGVYHKNKRISELTLRHGVVFYLGPRELTDSVAVLYYIDPQPWHITASYCVTLVASILTILYFWL